MQWTVDEADVPILIRDYLRRKKGISAKLLARLKRQPGGIMLNGRNVFVNVPLHAGDVLFADCESSGEDSVIIPSGPAVQIIFEDDYLLVLNKPPFMPTHPSRNHLTDSLANAVAQMARNAEKPFSFRPASRLDRNTSGIILTAKNQYAASLLSAMIRQDQITKRYLAILEPVGEEHLEESGFLECFQRRHTEKQIARTVVHEVLPDADYALTSYRILQRSKKGALILVCASPVTGRTHQLRIAFADAGCPVLGDGIYGTDSALISRQALHAFSLDFIHPVTGVPMHLEAPLFEDMKAVTDIFFESFDEHSTPRRFL